MLSRVQLFATSWMVARQAFLSVGFSMQEYWSGLPFPSAGDLRDPGIKSGSPVLQEDSLPTEPAGSYHVMNFFILCVKVLQSCLTVTPWTVACQAPLSVEFPRQEYWSNLPFPTPKYLPYPGIKVASLKSPALAGRFFTTSNTWEALLSLKPF